MLASVSARGHVGRRPWLATALLFACTAAEEPTEQPQPTKPTSEAAPVEAEPHAVAPAAAREYFIAHVGETGIEHCPDGHTFEWLDRRTTLGFVPTRGHSLAPWLGKLVLAKGESSTRTPRPADLPTPAPCPIMQMRSDFRHTPAGMRMDRGEHPPIEEFAVASVEALPLAVVREGDELVVTFTNPLPFALAELTLIGHYEGCYGKPGTMQVSSTPAPLARGASHVERLPTFSEDLAPGPMPERKGGPQAREHRLHSIQLLATPAPGSAPLHVDLDAPLSSFDLALECPEHEPASKATP
jgi:hypothetical protein